MAALSIESEKWHGIEFLEENDNPYICEKLRRCINDTRWDSLVAKCSELRRGISCTMSERFCYGTQNLVKLVHFEDNVKWVARVALEDVDERLTASLEDQMNSQISTYQYLKEHTKIPVPEVHGFSAHRTDEIGPPYVLLEYIHGTPADHCDLSNDQSTHVLEQLADVIVELAGHKFDKIGALCINGVGDFIIGKDLETGDGPYETAQEYYGAVSKHRFQHYANNYFWTNLDTKRDAAIHLPSLFNQMMDILTDCSADRGPFSLTNTDIGFHNILLDRNLKIIGLIDCDTVKAAPIHVLAQYPDFCDIVIAKPGLATTKPMAKKVLAEGTVLFNAFVDMVAKAERRVGGETPIANAMTSDGARLFEGLQSYMSLQSWVNVEWIESYWYMYYRALRGPAGALEFSDATIPKEERGDVGEDAKSPEDRPEEPNSEEDEENTKNDLEHVKPKSSGT